MDLPYACIPAGTRNHFAVDLGIDRDDVVGSLDAFVDGRERTVDLAEVNGRIVTVQVVAGIQAFPLVSSVRTSKGRRPCLAAVAK